MQESTGRSRDMFLSDGEAVCVYIIKISSDHLVVFNKARK